MPDWGDKKPPLYHTKHIDILLKIFEKLRKSDSQF